MPHQNRRRLLVEFYELADLLIMVGSFFFATWLVAFRTQGQSVVSLLERRLTVSNILIFLGLVMIWHLILKAFGLYQSKRLSSRPAEAFDVFKATSLGSLVVVNFAVSFDIGLISHGPWFVVTFWSTSTVATIGFHLLLRFALQKVRLLGHNLRDMLIVGTNGRALKFAEGIRNRPELGYQVIGFVDEGWPGLGEFRAHGGKLVSDLDGLAEYLRRHVVDEVVLALPVGSFYSQVEGIIRICEEQGITVRFLTDLFDMSPARARAEMFQDHPIVTIQAAATDGWPGLAKRALDFSVSLILLVALLPLFLGVAALINLLSSGPVFFVQERLGLNKRLFRLFKFRTMVVDAEEKIEELEEHNEAEGPVFKIARDPRLTPIGAFLRRYSIDELPQLLNVLKGEMSLVGPRPLPQRDYNGFSQDWHRRRFSVKPGLTCLWQVSGRSGIPFERWMQLDLEYIDRWTLWLDFKILARTVPVVLKGSGAF